MPIDFLDELKWRGLFYQCTDEQGLRAHLADPAGAMRRAYVGFDPTADSLTIGNMVTIMLLAHFQRAGHAPVVVSGGGTGLIGDPSGKSAERQLLTEEKARANVEGQAKIYEKLLDFSAGARNRATIVNNIDWLGKLGYIEALRDVGKHFSVNMMIQKDSVRERLENRDQGISYTEFSYMILQSYDYLVLFRDFAKHGVGGPVTLQMGGSDQWGNIVAGSDLIRRIRAAAEEALDAIKRRVTGAGDAVRRSTNERERESLEKIRLGGMKELIRETERLPSGESYGLTAPLVTKSDGGKFGKTESGAIWMTADKTSPYAFYQFWLNASDEDVPKFLKVFTFMGREEVEALIATHQANPGAREAHRALARHVTELLHGKSEVENAENAAKALFSGEIAGLPEATLREVLASVPSSTHAKSSLGDGVALIDLLVTTKLAASKREAKEFLAGGSVSVNGRKAGADDKVTSSDLLHGSMIALRRGKKSWHLTTWK